MDHNQDQILLMLNPAITTASAFGLMDWQLGYYGPNPIFFPLTIAELKDPTLMTTGTQKLIAAAGLSKTDFDAIRALDPFADLPVDTPIVDSNFDKTRFANVLSYAYKPSSNAGQGCLVDTNQITNTYSSDQTSEKVGSFAKSYTVSVKSSSSSDPGGPPVPTGNLGFSAGASITFTTMSTTTNSKSSTNTATVNLACPSPAYTGGELVDVYWDTLYGTFAFNTRDTLKENVLFQAHLPLPAISAHNDIRAQKSTLGQRVVELDYAGHCLRVLPDDEGNVTFYGQFQTGVDFGLLRYNGLQRPRAVSIGLKNSEADKP